MAQDISGRNAAGRKAERRKAERAFAPEASEEDGNRTTLSLALSVGDKKALKKRSLNEGKTIASIVHEWIAGWKNEVDG